MYKRKQRFSLVVCAVLCAVLCAKSVAKPESEGQADDRMGRYNVVWTSPSKDASGVMPIGNGDIAAGVYAIENGDLYLLLAKNDAFSFCGDIYKTGRVRVSLSPNPFAAGKPFRQTLDLPTGSIHIEADGVKLRIWADANRPIYHVEIDSPRKLSVSAQPEFWKRYTQWGGLDNTPDLRLDREDKIIWHFAVGDRSTFHEELQHFQLPGIPAGFSDPYRFNTFGNLLEGPGLSLQDGALRGQGTNFDLRIHALDMQTPDSNVWVKAIEAQASKPVDLGKDWTRHCKWWTGFWDRGWIIASDHTVPVEDRERFNIEPVPKKFREEKDGAALVAQSYNFFRFAMAAQSRGRVQTKFNGGIFTQQTRHTEPWKPRQSEVRQADGSWLSCEDYRAWGRRFTFQNQRLLYWPLLMSGDFDLMKPFFDYGLNLLEIREAITKAWFGHGGAFFRENTLPTGGCDDAPALPPRPEQGEGKFPDLSSLQHNQSVMLHQRDETLCKLYQGGYQSYYFTSGLERVAMMADYANYTGDTKFRDEVLVPFARQILLFFDLHYRRGADGKLLLYPSQAIETWWITVNDAPDVAGLHFCLDQLLAMKAGTLEDQARWRKLRAEIPAVPMQTIEGQQALAPGDYWAEKHNGENAELYPVFPFRCYGFALGTKDLVERTVQHRTSKNTFDGTCWNQDQIDWALAGNAQEAAAGLVRRFRYASTSCRLPLFGESADGVPEDGPGCGAIAFQRMLAQEGNGKIYLLPAWPAAWDVEFKLHLMHGAVVTGTVKNGQMIHWDIQPASLKKNVEVCQPQAIDPIYYHKEEWPGGRVPANIGQPQK
ncbi:MAG: DUF5703 domain-containing protein [Verrucomicrobiota bacterium]